MLTNSPAQELNDLLITRNFEVDALDASTGKPPVGENGNIDISAADMFSFDYVGESGQNYGTVVIMLGDSSDLTVFFGDNLGRSMEVEDKQSWYKFLEQLRMFAKRNLLKYDLQNLNRLKYTMQGMAALKEGLFESYTGTRNISYTGHTTEAKLMIKHSQRLKETDARYRYIESLFVETAEGERFKLPFTKLAGGRAMLEHVCNGGRPYDARGQHITQMVEQINVLSQFRRAHRGKVFEGAAAQLVSETNNYYGSLKKNLKSIQTSKGYRAYFESWSPADITESEVVVDDIKNLFVEQTVDPRILKALPVLAKVQEGIKMKEADIFETWADNLVEGTWAIPSTPEQQERLIELLSSELPVGPDANNATDQLYDLFGDDELFDNLAELAERDADADARPIVMDRLAKLAPMDKTLQLILDRLTANTVDQSVAEETDVLEEVESQDDISEDSMIENKIDELTRLRAMLSR